MPLSYKIPSGHPINERYTSIIADYDGEEVAVDVTAVITEDTTVEVETEEEEVEETPGT